MRNHHRWWATAVALVVGLIFVSVQQTGARWSDTVSLPGGKIQSGILSLTVGGSDSYTFTALGATGMFPNAFAQAPLTIHNPGDAAFRYRISNVTQTSASVPLTLTVWSNTTGFACTGQNAITGTQLYSGQMIGAQMPVWRTLAPAGSETLCLRGSMGSDAGPGVSTNVVFSFVAEQV